MTSSFSWLDFSEKDRRTALDVISLFGERETVDELGVIPRGRSSTGSGITMITIFRFMSSFRAEELFCRELI
jgi:hypothetical protein